MAGDQPELELIALGPAFRVHPDPPAFSDRGSPPECQVRPSQGLEQRDQSVRIVRVMPQAFDPEVVAEERRFIVRDRLPVASRHHQLRVRELPDKLQHRPLAFSRSAAQARSRLSQDVVELSRGGCLHGPGIILPEPLEHHALVGRRVCNGIG